MANKAKFSFWKKTLEVVIQIYFFPNAKKYLTFEQDDVIQRYVNKIKIKAATFFHWANGGGLRVAQTVGSVKCHETELARLMF